jgi:predicted transcriptional regulator of viral defense system
MELVRILAAEGYRIFTTEQARKFAPAAGVSGGYLNVALHYLTRSGWLVRLRKGLYALSSSVPGVAPVHEFEIAMAMVDPAAISHWSALYHHGLTNQIPRRIFVLTTLDRSVPRRRSQTSIRSNDGCPVDGTIYKFIQVKRERFFGTEKIWVGDARVTITDLERTLLDGLSMPQYCGDFSEVLYAFELKALDLNLERIIEYGLQWDAAMTKRLGWVLEEQGVEIDRLAPLRRVPIKGYRKLDPTGPRLGQCNRRWMIQENLPGKIKKLA